jgi:hypothetical protein
LFAEAGMLMARTFERGFFLVERLSREVAPLARFFPEGSDMHCALLELVAAAERVDALLRQSNEGRAERSHQAGGALW